MGTGTAVSDFTQNITAAKMNAKLESVVNADVEAGAAIAASKLAAAGRYVVQAHKTTVPINQSDAEVFEFTNLGAVTVVEVQVYCTATAATATVDVKEAGTTILSAVATPVAGDVVKPAIADATIATGAAVTVHVTTNGTGTITDLTVTLICKQAVVA